jgi:hypothetical protein
MKFRAPLLIVTAFALLTAMNSCTKNYTCQCTIIFTGAPGLPDSTVNDYTITDTKSNATSKCKAESGTFTNNGITTVENCAIY